MFSRLCYMVVYKHIFEPSRDLHFHSFKVFAVLLLSNFFSSYSNAVFLPLVTLKLELCVGSRTAHLIQFWKCPKVSKKCFISILGQIHEIIWKQNRHSKIPLSPQLFKRRYFSNLECVSTFAFYRYFVIAVVQKRCVWAGEFSCAECRPRYS